MRILYGANSQGQGHLSKAATLVPKLRARGHEVVLVTSGPDIAPPTFASKHLHFAGLPYAVTAGGMDAGATLRDWVRRLPRLMLALQQLRRFVLEWRPDVVLTDFEPLTASPLLDPHCEVIALSRQVALFDPCVPRPPDRSSNERLVRTVIRLFTCGADRLLGYHYAAASHRCVPLVIRDELRSARPEAGDHLFVYCHFEPPEPLIAWANRRRVRVEAFGYPQHPRGTYGHVTFQPPGQQGMLESLRTCRAALVGAGLTTAVEAYLLGKPVCVVPIPGQWEQQVNAWHLQDLELATALTAWDFEAALNTAPAAPNHPLRRWLSASADTVLDRVLPHSKVPVLDAAPGHLAFPPDVPQTWPQAA